MKVKLWLLWILGLGSIVATGEVPTDTSTGIVTASRTWRMADGTTKRLRFTGFAKNKQYGMFQAGNIGPGGKAFSEFAAEEQAVFADLRSGKLKLVSTPGLCLSPSFPNGKLAAWILENPVLWLGETRTWENSSRKRVKARLICLTDEDVSLLIGDTVGRVPLKELGADDLDYVARLKSGELRTYPDSVFIGGQSWDKAHGYTVSISGEKYVALAKQGSRFEEALKAALVHMKSKLDSSKWELSSFTEEWSPPPGGTHGFDTVKATPDKEDRPHRYIAEFSIKRTAEKEVRQIWPLLTSPKSWPGATLHIHVMADGSILEPELAK